MVEAHQTNATLWQISYHRHHHQEDIFVVCQLVSSQFENPVSKKHFTLKKQKAKIFFELKYAN